MSESLKESSSVSGNTAVANEVREGREQVGTTAKEVQLPPLQLVEQATLALREQNAEFATLAEANIAMLEWPRQQILELSKQGKAKEQGNSFQALERVLLPLLFEQALHRALAVASASNVKSATEAFWKAVRERESLRTESVKGALQASAQNWLKEEIALGRSAQEVTTACLASAVLAERRLVDLLEGLKESGFTSVFPFERLAAKSERKTQRLSGRLQSVAGSEAASGAAWGEGFVLAKEKLLTKERTVEERDLLLALFLDAFLSSHIALYDILAILAAKANDVDTEQFALMMKQQEKELLTEVQNFFFAVANKMVEETASK